MEVITLGEDEKIFRDIAYKALVEQFGKEEADKLIDAEEEEDFNLDLE